MSLALVNILSASEPPLTETELDAAIASDWKRHQELAGQRRDVHRATAEEWCQIRARLGAHLAQKQALLAPAAATANSRSICATGSCRRRPPTA